MHNFHVAIVECSYMFRLPDSNQHQAVHQRYTSGTSQAYLRYTATLEWPKHVAEIYNCYIKVVHSRLYPLIVYFRHTSEMPHLKITLPEPENGGIWHDVVAISERLDSVHLSHKHFLHCEHIHSLRHCETFFKGTVSDRWCARRLPRLPHDNWHVMRQQRHFFL
jgi:hypothetical protein